MVTTEWRVIVHTDFFYKITHTINSKEMALEYVERIMVRGDYYKDARGVVTYIPTARIMKIKLIPPGVELEETKTEVN
jgi:hypothetical protein